MPGCGWLLFECTCECVCPSVPVFECITCASSSGNNEIICFTLQTYGPLIRTEQRAVIQVANSHCYDAVNRSVGVVLKAV